MALIDRKTYKKIEYYLYNYDKIKKKIEEYKQDIAEARSRDIGSSGGGRSHHSDPTAIRALKLCRTSIVEDERWLRIVEATLERYADTEKEQLIRLKYERGLNEVRVCMELNIARRTYFRWRQEVVTYTALVAAQEGLIKVA